MSAIWILTCALFVGPISGGALWGWWGASLYCIGLLWSLASILLALGIQTLRPTTPGVRVLVFGMLIIAWGWATAQRHLIAGLAFGGTVLRPPHSWRAHRTYLKLEDLKGPVRHVFCATEMHAGHHAYFSHDFIYTPGFGIGRPGGLPLRAVVQASANFPGGFPLRFIRTRRFNFRAGENWIRGFPVAYRPRPTGAPETVSVIPKVLALTDGGVFDNLADAWHMEAATRRLCVQNALIEHQREIEANWLTRNGHTDDGRTQFMPGLEKLRAIHAAERDAVIATLENAGPSYRRECRHGPSWRSTALTALPFVGELLGLTKVSGTMYNNITSQRVRDLRHRFTGDHCGTVIDMNEWIGHPNPVGEDRQRRWGRLQEILAPNTRLRCCMNPTDAFEQRCCL